MVNDWFTLKSAPPTAATVLCSSPADAPATVRLTAAAQTTAAATTLGMGVRIGSPFPAALVGRNDRRLGPGGRLSAPKADPRSGLIDVGTSLLLSPGASQPH